MAIASALGGVTGSLGVSLLGLPHVFLVPALYGLVATTGFAVMSRSRHAVSLDRCGRPVTRIACTRSVADSGRGDRSCLVGGGFGGPAGA